MPECSTEDVGWHIGSVYMSEAWGPGSYGAQQMQHVLHGLLQTCPSSKFHLFLKMVCANVDNVVSERL